MSKNIVSVAPFIEKAGDAAAGVEQAVAHALAHGINTVFFPKGTYDLRRFTTIDAPSIAHDDGCGDISEKDCHIVLRDIDGLTLLGECDEKGTPASILAGLNPQTPQTLLPSILWCERCRSLTLRNLAFTRRPECAFYGVVKAVRGDELIFSPLPGSPHYDGMPAYCMNRFDLKARSLLGESLTFGFGFDKRWRALQDGTYSLCDRALAQRIREGEGLSFHQAGKTDFQLFFGGCDELYLDNVRIYNANSFAILTEACENIRARRLVIAPREGAMFAGPRDGWKIYRCTGDITLDSCHIEGVRMDGQNVHSNFMILKEIVSEAIAVFSCKYAPIPLRRGADMEFYDGCDIFTRRITAFKILGGETLRAEQDTKQGAAMIAGNETHSTLYRITFESPLPDFALPGTLCAPRCWEPARYVCRDTTFRNIAGAGHLLRCGEVLIERCTYQNMMNAGVLLGAELSTHCEGGHATGVTIRGCTFQNCGFRPRYGEFGCGCVAVKSQGFDGPYNRDIFIENNTFLDSQRALEIRDAKNVRVTGNHYRGILKRCLIDEATTEDIQIDD